MLIAILVLMIGASVPVASEFVLKSYDGPECNSNKYLLDTNGTLLVNGKCNFFNSVIESVAIESSGPGPYYKAIAPANDKVAFIVSQCTDSSCTKCNEDSPYDTNGPRRTGWDISGRTATTSRTGDAYNNNNNNDNSIICNSMPDFQQSFLVMKVGSGQTGEGGGGGGSVGVRPPTAKSNFPPTNQPAPHIRPQPTTASDPVNQSAQNNGVGGCKWTLNKYSASTVFSQTSCSLSSPTKEYNIIPDGNCHYNDELLYYEAMTTACGLTFRLAHCNKSDCTDCMQYSMGYQVFSDCLVDDGDVYMVSKECGFLGTKEEYIEGMCYSRPHRHYSGGGIIVQDFPEIWSFHTSPNCQEQLRETCNDPHYSSSGNKIILAGTGITFVIAAALAAMLLGM